MGERKRGLQLPIFLFIFLCILIPSVSAGYCANPAETDFYCSGDVNQEDCCPASTDYYGEELSGVPNSQSECELNFYDTTNWEVGGLCIADGCCYTTTEQYCTEASLEGACVYDGGEWSSGTCTDTFAYCAEGCCVYNDGTTTVSTLSSMGFCDTTLYGVFDSETTSASACSALVATYETADIECNDLADNDGDGYTDYPADSECGSSNDLSEAPAAFACSDGFDNDGDGYTDTADAGCCGTATTANEELCEVPVCSGTGVISSSCNCYATTEEAGTVCSAGNYCCSGTCQGSACTTACSSGERQYCGMSSDGCLMYETCDFSGNWGACTVTSSCGSEPEVCTDGTDNDSDGLVDCQDVDCYEVYCGIDGGSSACGAYGFEPEPDDVLLCCSTTDVNDCDGDGRTETCGACSCETTPVEPSIDAISFTRGSSQLTIEWTLACSVDFTLWRCTGESCPTDTIDYTEEEILTAFAEPIGTATGVWEYTDTTIGSNERYCYVVQASYPDGTNMFSQPSCIDDSGDYWCQQLSSSEFCLDAYAGMDEELMYRVGCTDENKMSYIENCHATYSSDYICTGPYTDGTTTCEYQSNCATCGDPLGLYATLTSGFADYLGTNTLCSAIPMCYYDYTLTTIDAYQECAEVSTCYDYASQGACTEQTNSNGFTNKCLQRNCEWVEFDEGDGIANGVCREYTSDYVRCDMCNSAVNNGIFDACTADRCEAFGIESATCYLSGLTGECTDIAEYTCTAYENSDDCSGDNNVYVYVGSTNEVVESEDALGIGLCYWNGATCYKDANGDTLADAIQDDFTPPVTTILSSDRLASISIELLATDYNPDGSFGSGVSTTYYCLSEDGTFCYPDTLVTLNSEGVGTIELGDGSGEYTLYYFSQDYAENLEVVQSFVFTVDKQAPQITITSYITADTSDPYDASTVTFEIVVDEEAYCTDAFETGELQIENQYNDHFVVKYEDLSDGYYLYTVTCTDSLGNTGDAYATAQVDADTAIFDSSPSYYTDTQSVTLSVKTFADASCGFSENTEESSFENMDDGFESAYNSAEGYYEHTRSWTLGENGLYFFDVKCQMSDGSEHDDEIQFVYDDTAPTTTPVDSAGNAFDFAAFYQGETLDLYLACTDQPAYGFGCFETYYCVDTETCSPTTLYDTTDAIPYDLTDISRLNVCYYSTEATFAGMGGLAEAVQCTEIKVDYYTPTLDITSPAEESVVYIPQVTITGTVDDPDAAAGTAENTVTITVLDTTGATTTYSNIDADAGFSATVNVTLETNTTEYNIITIYGKDRSGQTTAVETLQVRYTTELGDDAMWIVEPANGVSDEPNFDFVVGTYLEADICGYSKNDASLERSIVLSSVASDTAGEYQYGAAYSIDASKDGIEEYVYVKCRLINGVEYAERFILEYDSTTPVIESIEIINDDGKTPPSVVEYPLDPQIEVITDDRTKCKYSFDSEDGFTTGMTKFSDYDVEEYATLNNDTIYGLDDHENYTIYIACQNGAYMTSDIESLSFTIDSNAASGIYLISPQASGSRSFSITIGTTRSASSCTYGTTVTSITSSMTAVSEKEYKTGNLTVSSDGNYTYYFSCWFVDGEKTDYFTFPVDTTAPVVDYVEDGNISYSNTTLSATWSASDSLTEVVQYQYAIGTKPGYNDTRNWTTTTEKEAIVDGLSLKNQSTYYWNVRAQNEVGYWSSIVSSNGVFIDTDGAGVSNDTNGTTVSEVDTNTCANGMLDADETDIDCGGSCDACKAGSSCDVAADCTSLNCAGNICQESTCSDVIINQGESDFDCGGNYCGACQEGMQCVYHKDCLSGYCSSRVCSAPSCSDNIQNGAETGIDCGGTCGACETLIYQQDQQTKEDVDGGWSIWTWLLILLLLIGLLVGGYYGYLYYMKKKGKPVKGFDFPGLGSLGPTLSKAMPKIFPQKYQIPGMQRQQMQKIAEQKQASREKFFSTFEDKKPTQKLPEKVEQKPSVTEKKQEVKKEAPKKAPKKLGETIQLKKPEKKKSVAFAELDKLIKEKKK